MDRTLDFTTALRSFMARAACTNKDLARLTAISLNTLEGWTAGRVRRPRFVTDVLKLARALVLDAADTTTLLIAARHPALADLQFQARQIDDLELDALLAPWAPHAMPVAPAPPGPLPAQPSPALRHQLRPPAADFVGRSGEHTYLVYMLQQARACRSTLIGAIQGMGGIGKTELAYAVAHQLHDTFPDAQIVLNLQGASGSPLRPEQALQSVIRAFAPDMRMPDQLSDLEVHYRAVLHDRRVLILADDAYDAAQVRPLIPPEHSALLITSRQRFTLPGMVVVHLEQLADPAAIALLQRICPRLSNDDSRTMIRACGALPLALRVSGSILSNNPALGVATYLAWMADERQRLNALRDPDDPQLDVAASLALSYAGLAAADQWVFRQLGVLVADFDLAMAQNVIDAAAGVDAVAALYTLLRRNLIMYDTERARWQLHDLVRDLARCYLKAAGEWEATSWRYAHAALQVLQAVQARYLANGADVVAALARFDTERPHIDAARRWAAAHAGTSEGDTLLLADALAIGDIMYLRYNPQHESIPQFQLARVAAQNLGHRNGEARILNRLGMVYADLGEIRPAIAAYEQALAITRAMGDRRCEAMVLNNLGLSYWRRGEIQPAIDSYEQVLAIARALGVQLGESIALNNLGLAAGALGDAARAIAYHEQALQIAQAIDDSYGEGLILSELGQTYMASGDARRAISTCTHALRITSQVRDRREEGSILTTLGMAYAAVGETARAFSSFEEALAIFRALGYRHGEARCRWHYGLALIHQAEYARALPLLRLALAYEQAIGHVAANEHAALIARLEAGEGLDLLRLSCFELHE